MSKLTKKQQQLVNDHIKVAKINAWSWTSNKHNIPKEDLEGMALEELVICVKEYRKNNQWGASFKTFLIKYLNTRLSKEIRKTRAIKRERIHYVNDYPERSTMDGGQGEIELKDIFRFLNGVEKDVATHLISGYTTREIATLIGYSKQGVTDVKKRIAMRLQRFYA